MEPDDPVPSADPYDWTIDEVIQALTSPNGLLAKGISSFNFGKIKDDLRSNDVNGDVLLAELHTREAIKETFGITSRGQQRQFVKEILNLRQTSEKWQLSPEGIEERRVRENQLLAEEHASHIRYLTASPAGRERPLSGLGSKSPTGFLPSLTYPAQLQQQLALPQNLSHKPQDDALNSNRLGEPLAVNGGQSTKKRKIAPQFVRALTPEGAVLPGDAEKVELVEQPLIVVRENQPGYLGFRRTHVNELFYSQTSLDQEIQHAGLNMHRLEIELLKKGNWDGPLPPERRAPESHPEMIFSFVTPFDLCQTGRTLYVNDRMKRYLRTSDAAAPDRYIRANQKRIGLSAFNSRGYSFGFKPYPERILKFSATSHAPAMTMYSGGTARRVRIRDWAELDSNLAEAEDIYNELEAKWANADANESDLPLYGDSGSEGNVYSDMDDSEDNTPTLPKVSNVTLSVEETRAIVEEEIAKYLELWQTSKKPKLEAQAWSIWRKSRRTPRRTYQQDLRVAQAYIDRLEDRLEQLTSDLVENRYEKVEDLRKQCISLHTTLGERAATQWKIDLVKQNFPPARPTRGQRAFTSNAVRQRPVDLASDEEELSSEEDYHFIDDSADFDEEENERAHDAMLLDEAPDKVAAGVEFAPSAADDATDAAQPTPTLAEYMELSDNNAGEDLSKGLSLRQEEKMPDARSDIGYMGIDEIQLPVHNALVALEPSPRQSSNVPSEHEDSDDSLLGAPHVSSNTLQDPSVRASDVSPNGSNFVDIENSFDEPSEPRDVDPLAPNMVGINDTSEESHVPRDATPQATSTPNLVDSLTEDRLPKDGVRDAAGVITSNTGETKVQLTGNFKFYSSDLEPVDYNSAVPSTKNLPQMTDFGTLRKLNGDWIEFIMEQKRRDLILAKLLVSARSPHRWRVVASATKGKSAVETQPEVWNALDLLKKHHLKIRNKTPEESDAYMQLAVWFTAWFCCYYPDESRGMPVSKLDETIQSGEEDFERFYDELGQLLLTLKLSGDVQTPSNRLVSKIPFKKKDEALKPEVSSSKQGKKTLAKMKRKPLSESQEAADVRAKAADRKRQADSRARQIQRLHLSQGFNADAKVYINQGKTDDEEFVEVNHHIASRIKPHQVEGINFLWREAVGAGEGVLLAHVMGLGKTMQCITLLVTIAEAAKHKNGRVWKQIPKNLLKSKTLIVCPPTLVDNWYDELLKWVPRPHEDIIGEIRKISTDLSDAGSRVFEIREWVANGGILLISYTLLWPLIINRKASKSNESRLSDTDYESIRTSLLEEPNIVIADEAQYFKNPGAKVSIAMRQFKTKVRVALTGSPLANNLAEYFHIIDWCCPGFLGKYIEFKDEFERPISDGLYADASHHDQRQALRTLRVLEDELAPKVHRADYNVLKGDMRGKNEFVIHVPPTDVQKQCYVLFVESIRGGLAQASASNIIAWIGLLKLLCNHPSCFLDKLKEEGGGSNQPLRTEAPSVSAEAMDDELEKMSGMSIQHMGLSKRIVEQQLQILKRVDLKELRSPEQSNKTKLLMEILSNAQAAGEKTLIFSHSLATLDYIEKYIVRKQWSGKQSYLRLDGTTATAKRQQIARALNEGGAQLMLVSTRAGGAGLNLFGASRVVIIDDSFNPMNEQQAIGRSYRIGQRRHVYVYRFVITGSFEEVLQNQAVYKLQLATRVVDKKDTVRMANKGMSQYITDMEDREQMDLEPFFGKDMLILDRILEKQPENPSIRSIVEGESFFAEEKEQLTAEEEATANEQKALRRLRRTDPAAYEKRMQEIQRQGFYGLQPASFTAAYAASTNLPLDNPSDITNTIYRAGVSVVSSVRQLFGSAGGPISAETPPEQPGNELTPIQIPRDQGLAPEPSAPTEQSTMRQMSLTPSMLSSSSVESSPHLPKLSDDVRESHKPILEEVLQQQFFQAGETESHAQALAALAASKIERQIYKMTANFAGYSGQVGRVSRHIKAGQWNNFIEKSRKDFQQQIQHENRKEARQNDIEPRVADPNRVNLHGSKDGNDSRLTQKASNHIIKRHIINKPRTGLGRPAVKERIESEEDDSHDSSPGVRKKRQKAYVEDFSMDPVSVERLPYEDQDLEEPGDGVHQPTLDGAIDKSPRVKIKSEDRLQSQGASQKTTPAKTAQFRMPVGLRTSQEGKRNVEMISLLTSDEDTDDDDMGITAAAPQKPSTTTETPAPSNTRATTSQPNPPERSLFLGDSGSSSGTPKPSSSKTQRTTKNPREKLMPFHESHSSEESYDESDDLSIPHRPISLSSAHEQTWGFGNYPALRDAYESGTKVASQGSGRNGRSQ